MYRREKEEPGQSSEQRTRCRLRVSRAPSGGKAGNRHGGGEDRVQVGGDGGPDQGGGHAGEGKGLSLGCISKVEPVIGFADRLGVGVRQMSQG